MLSKAIFRIRPYVVEGCRTGAIFATGDILAQTVVEKKDFNNIDYVRTIKYSSLGILFVGPLLKYWYALLDRKVAVNQSRLQRTVKKMLVDQLTMAPALNLSIMSLVGLINHESSEIIKERIKIQYIDIMKTNYMMWPGVQMINFSIVPVKYQVVFVQLVAVVWNCFLSRKCNDDMVTLNKM